MSSLLQNYGTCILLVDVLLRLFSLYTDLMRRHFRYCRLTDGNGLADVNEKWKNMHIVRAEKKVYQRKNEQEWEKKGNRIYRKSVCSFFFLYDLTIDCELMVDIVLVWFGSSVLKVILSSLLLQSQSIFFACFI